MADAKPPTGAQVAAARDNIEARAAVRLSCVQLAISAASTHPQWSPKDVEDLFEGVHEFLSADK